MQLIIEEPKKIRLTNAHIREVTLAHLRSKFEGYGLEKRAGEMWLYDWEDTHGSGITTYKRVATDRDKALYLLINELAGDSKCP